jgi:hypothetical protein
MKISNDDYKHFWIPAFTGMTDLGFLTVSFYLVVTTQTPFQPSGGSSTSERHFAA